MLFALISTLGGCQPLDTGAALGEPFSADSAGTPSGKSEALSTRDIELEDGSVAANGCEAIQLQAYQILDRTCAHCHGGGSAGARQGTPPFDCVLDEERLVSMVSATAKDPETHAPARFLKPGDADHSRIYLRPLAGEMPPPDVIGLPANPRPSVSDLSVLRHWIESCIPASDNGGNVEPGDTAEPGITH
jgi:hypothetical protein